MNAKKSELDSAISGNPGAEEEQHWKQRQILDHSWVKKTVQELRMLMERQVNRVFIVGNLAEKTGRVKGENSLRIIQHELSQHIHDYPVHFLSDANKPDFAERKQQDEFADNCIYVVENLNFYPEEHGYIEPEVVVQQEVEEPLADGEEKKEEASAPKDSKKLKKDENSKQQQSQPISEVVEDGAAEEPEEPAPIEEPFNSHTIHQFKKNLGSLGEVYINDAPLASLSSSNTTCDIKCAQKVMGMKMTEEMRNIAQFFMKQFPLDIDSIYHKKPDSSLEYYTFRSAAIIGGVCASSSDILEKILLANSFLDTFEQIFLVGEIGLAATHALGLNPGRVERTSNNKAEYDSMKEFFVKLFERSVEKNCAIKIPVDFICAPKASLEQIVAENSGKGPAGVPAEGTDADKSGDVNKTQGSKASGGQPLDVSEVQQANSANMEATGQSNTAVVYDPSFTPTNWADAQIFYGKAQTLDLEAQIQKSFGTMTEKLRKEYLMKQQSSGIDLKIAEASLKDLGSMGSAANVESVEGEAKPEGTAEEGGEPAEEAVQGIPEDHYVLAYGPKTIKAIQEAIRLSFKLFWDGAVCLMLDTTLACANNKEVLNTLLDVRTKTNEHEDPPVTLLHGQQTEKLLRDTLQRIKIEQQQALEAKKRAAEDHQAQDEASEMDMGEDDNMDLADESEEKISTFQEDLDIITDFSCFTSSDFTTKIMQGMKLRCMLSFGEHKKPSKEQVEEDLSILDEV